VTVRVAELLVKVLYTAEMVAFPVDTPVATPLLLIVATEVGFELQVMPVVIGWLPFE
jgi:hypothetical protein